MEGTAYKRTAQPSSNSKMSTDVPIGPLCRASTMEGVAPKTITCMKWWFRCSTSCNPLACYYGKRQRHPHWSPIIELGVRWMWVLELRSGRCAIYFAFSSLPCFHNIRSCSKFNIWIIRYLILSQSPGYSYFLSSVSFSCFDLQSIQRFFDQADVTAQGPFQLVLSYVSECLSGVAG